jgi:c-di-GMP-binding flagellar brake protein YcgR
MGIIPDIYLNSVCEIKSSNNVLLASGRIVEISDEYLKLDNKGDLITIIKYGTRIKINVFGGNKSFISLIGKVYISTIEFMQVSDVQILAEAENRSFFRIKTDLKGIVTYQETKDSEPKALEVDVDNVSLCGLLFSTKHIFKEAEPISILLPLPNGSISFLCTIRRIEAPKHELDEKRKYGCEFDEATQQQIDKLWIYILNKQREEIRARKKARER